MPQSMPAAHPNTTRCCTGIHKKLIRLTAGQNLYPSIAIGTRFSLTVVDTAVHALTSGVLLGPVYAMKARNMRLLTRAPTV